MQSTSMPRNCEQVPEISQKKKLSKSDLQIADQIGQGALEKLKEEYWEGPSPHSISLFKAPI